VTAWGEPIAGPPGVARGAAAPSGAASARDAGGDVPARARGITLLGEVSGSGYRQPPSLVRRADGQTIQLTPLLYRVLEEIDGTRDFDAVAAAVGERTERLLTADDVEFLVEQKLRPLGVLRAADGTDPAVKKASPLLALKLKLVVSNPTVTRLIAAPFAQLFRPVVVAALLVAFVLATWWVAFEHGLAAAARQALYQPSSLLLVLALTTLSAAFHELGHAAACRYGGAKPGAMGVGLYLVWPAFYTDVTDSYRLGRGGRLRVDLGGLYFNAVFAVAVLGVWTAVRTDALLLVVAAQIVQMVRQLMPLVRFDGYHVLADLTGVPDLFQHIRPTLLGLLPGRRGRRGRGGVLRPWARAVVSVWVAVVVPVLMAMLVLMVVMLPRIVATAWDSLGLQWGAVGASWGEADVAALAVCLLRMVTVALPVAGIGYLLVRIVRRTVGRVWRGTTGRPRLRVAAVLAGALVVTGVGWAWWPGGQYRPIGPNEEWRLGPSALARLLDGREAAAQPLLRGLEPVSARTTRSVRPAPVAAVQRFATSAPQPPAGGGPAIGGEGFVLALPAAPPSGSAPPGAAPPAAPVPDLPRTGSLTPHSREPSRIDPLLPSAAPPPTAAPEPESKPEPLLPPAAAPPAAAPEPESEPLPPPEPAPAPAAAEPAPAPAPAESAWLFPYDPPRDPKPGDNQARVINTRDGATEVDVRSAFLWIRDGAKVDQRNEAYAYARCTACRSVAVAFQVVLIVGYSDVIQPVNAAAALNYACNSCVTHAVAVQLVATLAREPSPTVLAALTQLETQVEQSRDWIAQLPTEQIYGVLLAVRTRVLEILASDRGDAPVATTAAATSDKATPPATTDATTAPAAAPTATPAPSTTQPATTTTATTSDTTTTATTPPTTTTATAPATTSALPGATTTMTASPATP